MQEGKVVEVINREQEEEEDLREERYGRGRVQEEKGRRCCMGASEKEEEGRHSGDCAGRVFVR